MIKNIEKDPWSRVSRRFKNKSWDFNLDHKHSMQSKMLLETVRHKLRVILNHNTLKLWNFETNTSIIKGDMTSNVSFDFINLTDNNFVFLVNYQNPLWNHTSFSLQKMKYFGINGHSFILHYNQINFWENENKSRNQISVVKLSPRRRFCVMKEIFRQGPFYFPHVAGCYLKGSPLLLVSVKYWSLGLEIYLKKSLHLD